MPLLFQASDFDSYQAELEIVGIDTFAQVANTDIGILKGGSEFVHLFLGS